MSKTAAERNLEARADLFKALGHPARILLLNLVRIHPRHGEELAAILGLSPATVSHHLAKLEESMLLESRKEQYYQIYSLRRGALAPTLEDLVSVPHPGMAAHVEEDAFREKVLEAFLKRGRLVTIPAQRKKRQIVLERLVQEFAPDRDYPEREVNQILVEFHDDVATLRREMVGYKLMKRAAGIYRRIADRAPGD
jgi:ArsR family transcriptional regulator, arsenate/arsenite/antimonite-responsive transcriptional repressor